VTVTTEFKGGRALQAALRELANSRAINAAGREGLKAGAQPIADLAITLAPEFEHKLKSAIKVGPARGKGNDKDHLNVVVGIDRSVDPPSFKPRLTGKGSYRDPGVAGHSVIIEFGRAGAAAQPFMTPAMDSQLPLAPERIGAALWPAIEKQARRLAK
jgi:hypothetical protein